jgi:membrane associated rhomboid family serine protease
MSHSGAVAGQKQKSSFIHSETFLVLHVLKLVLLSPFLIILYLFNHKVRDYVKRETSEVKNFFFEAKWTNCLILINVLIFLVQIFYLNNSGFITDYVLKFEDSFLFPQSIFAAVASWFLHANLLHLLGNMLVLFIFGRIIEREYGGNLLWIYFGSGIVSSILSGIMGESGIGASGCIAGLISTAILFKPFYFTYYLLIPLPIILVGWLSIWADISGLLSGVQDNIGHFAHLGGYIAVMFFVFFFHSNEKKKLVKGVVINLIFIALVVLGAFFLRGKIL